MSSLEKERVSLSKTPTKRQLTSRGRDTSQQLKTKTFKSTARQVWMANLLAKQRTKELTLKPTEHIEKKELNIENNAGRPQTAKRRGTPDIFPMSVEMKRTILLLGNLDLLPQEERLQQIDNSNNEGQKINKFKLKTRQRIIQPQRFLRGMKNGVTAKDRTAAKEESSNINSKGKEDLISEETGFVDNCQHHDNTSENSENDNSPVEAGKNRLPEKIVEKRKMSAKSARVSSSYGHKKLAQNAWSKSMKKYQTLYTLANPTYKTNFNRTYELRTPTARKYHSSSKTWQPDRSLEMRSYPIRRAFSLESGKGINAEEYITDDADIAREGRTVGEIADDIQFRCSKWFEFRQKILKHRDLK